MGEELTEVLKALVEIREADGPQDCACQSKDEASGGNACKEGPSLESLAERGRGEQSTPTAQHRHGDDDEDVHEDFAFLADGVPAKEHPRNHQLRRKSVKDYLTSEPLYIQCTPQPQ